MKNTQRSFKVPTPESLAHIALHYLSRFAASEASLRRVLENRLRRSALRIPSFAQDNERQLLLRRSIETIIARHKMSGVLNDATFAEIKINSLRRRGRSTFVIRQKLRQNGIKSDLIDSAFLDHEDGAEPLEVELKAAVAFARRKRLGSFRMGETAPDRNRKDFAAMARAGFSMDLARKALRAKLDDEDMDLGTLDD